MVLESLIPVRLAERKPIEMLPLAFLYASLAIFIALWIFPNHASLTTVFFTVMALLPLMVSLMRFEEESVFKKNVDYDVNHKRAMPFFVWMFLGMVLAYSLWFVAFPQSLVNNLFSVQINTIQAINNNINQVTANAISVSSYFMAVLVNNLKVLLFVLLFSFIYGAGAIFILTWNASVVAVAIGNTARKAIAGYAGSAGITGVSAYFAGFSLGLLRYMIHGIPEIGAYFVGGLAGGMISVAVLRHEFMDQKFNRVLYDCSNLILLAIGLLLVAGVLETFVSPMVPI
ncbi:hypothetical protein HN924_00735 [Candidatus Woesearchaeota archaeon]|jgi:uncharacterized membrane protein SpoIIM required for sporulation|nr:hypothetical protein [Candidatus Woesearchaeota archaeon]MBT7062479.1 hypothetical protein [Candidatus Woesearchaeota archaeon]MBT7402912.1 hypothetical protein [Candidatus Woesearchaeota archaeon]